jgi:hypothetical protein
VAEPAVPNNAGLVSTAGCCSLHDVASCLTQ